MDSSSLDVKEPLILKCQLRLTLCCSLSQVEQPLPKGCHVQVGLSLTKHLYFGILKLAKKCGQTLMLTIDHWMNESTRVLKHVSSMARMGMLLGFNATYHEDFSKWIPWVNTFFDRYSNECNNVSLSMLRCI